MVKGKIVSAAGKAGGKGRARGAGSSVAAGAGKAEGRGDAHGERQTILSGDAQLLLNRGTKFEGGDTREAEKGKAAKGARTKAQVIADVKRILALDSRNALRFKTGRLNISAVADEYLNMPALKPPVGKSQIMDILGEAIKSGDLAISTSKVPK